LTFGTLVEAWVTWHAPRGVGAKSAAVARDGPTKQVREERPVRGGGLGRGQQRTIARFTHALHYTLKVIIAIVQSKSLTVILFKLCY